MFNSRRRKRKPLWISFSLIIWFLLNFIVYKTKPQPNLSKPMNYELFLISSLYLKCTCFILHWPHSPITQVYLGLGFPSVLEVLYISKGYSSPITRTMHFILRGQNLKRDIIKIERKKLTARDRVAQNKNECSTHK